MAREEQTLFHLTECQTPALRLRAGELHRNFVRERKGQNFKCTIRNQHGRIVATVYTGERDAQRIIDCVNAMADMEERERAKADFKSIHAAKAENTKQEGQNHASTGTGTETPSASAEHERGERVSPDGDARSDDAGSIF